MLLFLLLEHHQLILSVPQEKIIEVIYPQDICYITLSITVVVKYSK